MRFHEKYYYIVEEKVHRATCNIFSMKPWIHRTRALMREQGLTQEALANKVGRGQSWVNHKLSGRRKTSADDILAIARALHTDPSDLLSAEFGEEIDAGWVYEESADYQASRLRQILDDTKKLDPQSAKAFVEQVEKLLKQRLKKHSSKKSNPDS